MSRCPQNRKIFLTYIYNRTHLQRRTSLLFDLKNSYEKKKDEKLLLNSLPFAGITTTYSADTLITDSAAAGTALATGYKTNNGYIAKDVNGKKSSNVIRVSTR